MKGPIDRGGGRPKASSHAPQTVLKLKVLAFAACHREGVAFSFRFKTGEGESWSSTVEPRPFPTRPGTLERKIHVLNTSGMSWMLRRPCIGGGAPQNIIIKQGDSSRGHGFSVGVYIAWSKLGHIKHLHRHTRFDQASKTSNRGPKGRTPSKRGESTLGRTIQKTSEKWRVT